MQLEELNYFGLRIVDQDEIFPELEESRREAEDWEEECQCELCTSGDE